MNSDYKVLYLTSNEAGLPLAEWIGNTAKVEVVQGKINLDIVKQICPNILISYNYAQIVKDDVLDYMRGKSINMHISMLPWNKGADPNFWSFVDDTPKGVTIHQMVPELDVGAIIYQKECFFDPQKETFVTTYDRLQCTIQELFKEHWSEIRNFEYQLVPQTERGSYHKHSQLLELREKIPFEWTDYISDYLKKYKQYQKNHSIYL